MCPRKESSWAAPEDGEHERHYPRHSPDLCDGRKQPSYNLNVF